MSKLDERLAELGLVVPATSKPVAAYIPAVASGNLVFTSGQLGLGPATMELVEGGIEAQTRQVLTNLKHVLETADSGLKFVVKTTVFLQDMADFVSPTFFSLLWAWRPCNPNPLLGLDALPFAM